MLSGFTMFPWIAHLKPAYAVLIFAIPVSWVALLAVLDYRRRRSNSTPRYLDGVLVNDDGPQWVKVNGIRYEREERR